MATPTYRTELAPWVKKVILALIIITAGFSIYHFLPKSWFGGTKQAAAPSVPPKAELPAGPSVPSSVPPRAVVATVAPPTSSKPGCANLPEVRMTIWAWNAQQGLLFAAGGPRAVENSLMCQNGVNLAIEHNDDTSVMTAELLKCAAELGQGKTDCASGTNFIAIMGDGSAAYFAATQPEISKVCPDCKLEIVGSAGYSRGEDKFMGLPAWKQDPNAARGGFIAGVLRDGDWNIAMKWAGDNGICNNPDEKTYDPNCLNWVNADSYTKAAEMYVAGTCEDRPVVKNGKRTGDTAHICVNGVVTWTPGDVTVAEGKGGLVSILSTKENIYQMPNVVIGISTWDAAHRPQVVGPLKAMTDGGQQLKQNPAALARAAQVSQDVYAGQEGAAYWATYFNPTPTKDKQGLVVDLGGSSVNNLADNQFLFGLTDGAGGKGVGLQKSIFAATYTVFGDIVVHYYPDLVPRYPSVASVVNTSYLEAVQQAEPAVAEADVPTYAPVAPDQAAKPEIGHLNWSIQFKTGSSDFNDAAFPTLDELYKRTVTNNARIEITGHTDNVGTDKVNLPLSMERARAVQQYLMSRNPKAFPESRFSVDGRGGAVPIASNATAAGQAKNRRVEIVMREN